MNNLQLLRYQQNKQNQLLVRAKENPQFKPGDLERDDLR